MVVDEVMAPADKTAPKVVTHLTPAESRAKGKAARVKVPRDSHASFAAGPDRPDPVSLLEEQATTRVPELVPIRYGRMLVSPFTFFRGAALIMASDLSTAPRSGLTAQVCGDAHLSNFGAFGSPERSARVRLQRLRRDPARPVGVGREATRRELRGRRPRPRFLQEPPQGSRADAGPGLPRDDARHGFHDQPGGLVLPRRRRGGHPSAGHGGSGDPVEGRGPPGGHRHQARQQGPDEGFDEGGRQADHSGRRRALSSSASRRSSCPSRSSSRTSSRRPWSTSSTASSASTARPCRRTAATCSSSTASVASPARWSGWAAWAHGPGSS